MLKECLIFLVVKAMVLINFPLEVKILFNSSLELYVNIFVAIKSFQDSKELRQAVTIVIFLVIGFV